MMQPRKLSVLDLNDRGAPSFETGLGSARHFDIRRLKTWKQVQQDIGGADPCRPDIVLADVDFEQDSSVRPEAFPGCDGAKPLGPILALAYVGGRAVWAFAVYSAHFTRNTTPVMQSPWVLLPFGILAAKLEGRVFHSTGLAGHAAVTGSDALEAFLKDRMSRLGNEATALDEALRVYVQRLEGAITKGLVRVTNAEQIRERLLSLKGTLNGNGARVTIEPDVFLELYSSTYGVDRIKWHSICADILAGGTEVDADDLDDMLQIAERLSRSSDPVFQKVLNVIERQDQVVDREMATLASAGPQRKSTEIKKEREIRRPRFDKLVEEMYSGETESVLTQIFALGVLLANVYGWAESDFKKCEKAAVYKRLGIYSGENVYRGWLGDRSASKRITSLNIPCLRLFSDSTGHETFLLDWGKSTLSNQDKARISHFLSSFGYDVPPKDYAYLS